MASSRSYPAFLNPVASKTEQDRSVSEAEFPELWKAFESDVFRLVNAELGDVSLHRAETTAGGTGGIHKDLLASAGAVRGALRGRRFIIPDLVQEVRIAMWQAIRRKSDGSLGGLRASVHAVRAWLRTTVRFITKRHVTRPAMLLFAAGSASIDVDNSECRPCEEPAHAVDLELLTDRARNLDQIAKYLTPKQVQVIRALVAGFDYSEIAEQLGISESYARVLFYRAKERLVDSAGARAGPRNGGGHGGHDCVLTKRQYARSHNRKDLQSLTFLHICATLRQPSQCYWSEHHTFHKSSGVCADSSFEEAGEFHSTSWRITFQFACEVGNLHDCACVVQVPHFGTV